jgi:hypothetical protein
VLTEDFPLPICPEKQSKRTGVGISISIRVAYSASACDEMDLGWNENVSQLYLGRGDPRDRSGGMSLTTTAGTSSASPGQVILMPSCRRRNASDHPRLASRTYEARFECGRRVAFGKCTIRIGVAAGSRRAARLGIAFASRVDPTVADRRPAPPRVSEAARHDKIVDTFDSSRQRRPDCNIPDSEEAQPVRQPVRDLLA